MSNIPPKDISGKYGAYWLWLGWITGVGGDYYQNHKRFPPSYVRSKGETVHGLVQQYWKQWGIG